MTGFAVYGLDTPRAARTIRARLEKRQGEIAALIARGVGINGWDDYKHQVGVLEGLDEALRVCDDIEKEAEEK